jgi:multiple sugar transport system ATP-binding protein
VSSISLQNLSKTYPNGVQAVNDVSLEIGDGELMVLVGPSGCGKTTLMRMIAGLEAVTEGQVLIDGKDMTNTAPKERDVAMVFQNYALYPHMTIGENIGFPLRLRRVPKAERKVKIAEAARILGLSATVDRHPGQLSGGQRQRVAMGRAIVREASVFLMDEPLSNLDAKLRVEMRAEILQIQRRVGVATVYVTHDQTEAMTMGDRVAVLDQGTLQQCATPQSLYDEPTNLTVAAFIGSPPMNLFEAELESNGSGTMRIGTNTLRVGSSPRATAALAARAGTKVVVGVRPEEFEIATDDQTPAIVGEIELVEALGSEVLVHFSSDVKRIRPAAVTHDPDDELPEAEVSARDKLVARLAPRSNVHPGDTVRLVPDPDQLHFFDPETGEAIR